MSSSWIKIIIAVIAGVILGLVYGWWIEPVEYTDVTPNILRADYQADYVLMVAEAFQTEQNADAAARRLAVMTSEAPSVLVANTLDYARLNGFTPNEILLLQNLLLTMQTYQPQGNLVP
jgi:hypothetical protein